MIMLSTILFIDDQPVGYTVSVEKEKCIFKPSEHSAANVEAPSFSVTKEENKWEVEGHLDQKIIDQLSATLPAIGQESDPVLSAAP